MKQVIAASLVATLCLSGAPARALAQDKVTETAKKTGEATKEGAKKTGEATKEGAKKTGEVTKEGAKKTGEVTKTGAKKTGEATKEGTKAVAKTTADATTATGKGVKSIFTGDVTVVCNDGKKHSGKTNKEACAKFGGVKP